MTDEDLRCAVEALSRAAKVADSADVIAREYYGLKPWNEGDKLRRVIAFLESAGNELDSIPHS
jgi:hypothetical protein